MASEDFKTVRSSVLLSEYIARFTSKPPRRAGSEGQFMAFCPLHDNTNTEAMSIDDRKGVWKCFAGCGGGDVFHFWEILNGVKDRGASLRAVAQDLNVTLPERERSGERSLSATAVKRALLAVAEAAHRHLMREGASEAADAAYAYLEGREVSEDIMERWQIGVLPSGRAAVELIKKAVGKSIPEAIEGGVLAKSEHDGGLYSPFNGRILFPILDRRGDVIGFGGRQIPEIRSSGKGKYINPSNTLVYHKAKTLYGEHLLTGKTKSVVVVEGYLDVIAVNESGGLGVGVACCGTSLTSGHAEVLSSFPKVTALFDSDEAGQKALAKAVTLANHLQSNGAGAVLPEGLDPWDAYLADDGSLAQTINGAQPLIAAAAAAQFGVSESPAAFDGWVAEKLATIESSTDRDALLRASAKLRGRTVSAYGSTVGTIAVRSHSSTNEEGAQAAAQLSPATAAVVRRLFQMDEMERSAVTASMALWDDSVDRAVSMLVPSADDLDLDVLARMIAPGAEPDPDVDAVLATLLPHPDDAPEDISVVLRNAITATLRGMNHDQDRWMSQVASQQAMTLRRMLDRISDVPAQPALLAWVMDTALDASLAS